MDEDQAQFKQLTLSDFKKRSSAELKTFHNCPIVMNNNSDIIWVS